MNGYDFRDAVAKAAGSCDGHVTHGSLEAIVRVFDEQMVLEAAMEEKECEQKGVAGMVRDLEGGGWARARMDLWLSPWGDLYRGPHKAWHIWAGTPMCEPTDV